MKESLIVGAGLSGAVLARQLAEAGLAVHIIEARPMIGGNCHTTRDPETGIMVHDHGPHIFHTDPEAAWRHLQRFGEWVPFVHRVKARTRNGIYSLPINLSTINQFFKMSLSPSEAATFLAKLAEPGIGAPQNFEEQALRLIGRELYEAFFKGYTLKQWGCHPVELPASILQRLPVRFSEDGSYYNSRYQAIPRDGYTQVMQAMLDHPCIRTSLSTPWEPAMRQQAEHVFFSGALDQFYGFADGRLGYRTVYWERETHEGDFQSNAQVNYTGLEAPWTRILEYKHFSPWESHSRSAVFREFSRETAAGDEPYYPKRLAADLATLARYVARAEADQGVSFIGRLGTYRYLDMDQVVEGTLSFAARWLGAQAKGERLPVFSAQPL